MKLDPKIKENAIIGHCFNSEELKRYIGQVCYFVDALEDFSDLINPFEGVLKAVSPDATVCYVAEAQVNGSPAEFPYCFCLPAVFVEKKQYRPFTLSEFTEKFPVGQPIKFRKKGKEEDELYLILLGYRGRQCNGKTIPNIYIGYSMPFTLDELFNDYEWQDPATGDWAPFGVPEE